MWPHLYPNDISPFHWGVGQWVGCCWLVEGHSLEGEQDWPSLPSGKVLIFLPSPQSCKNAEGGRGSSFKCMMRVQGSALGTLMYFVGADGSPQPLPSCICMSPLSAGPADRTELCAWLSLRRVCGCCPSLTTPVAP